MAARFYHPIAVVVAGMGLAALGLPLAAAADEASEIAAVRAATEKYQDVNVALAEGFILSPPGECVTAAAEGLPPEWGAMGLHYIHPGILELTATEPRVDGTGTHTDFHKPAILLYEPQADGSLTLVAVENLVFQVCRHRWGQVQ